MFRSMLKSKIHRATVTEADLNYVGSITIDPQLLEAVDILPNEKVLVVNNNNGERFETYAILGEPGSGQICVNGAAARLVQPGDLVIIMAFALVSEAELADFEPKVAFMNRDNTIAELVHVEDPQTTFV
ncbi:aspartate 1-decarboxylase [Alicyclobacillus fastidiosus]|uniref:Aspartate 1-decarboxylase n=1 Tax=Alicyclobacillus fastidiosus TaxID=392011 RepID=A0ABV5AHK7_9BACL|nr:aspartate 1-decarboxylase [Alicyclobacillus fastidiosus]WEH09148.1 aspartate 1-decarboxylase [Alicyclobacillus fastidiosus]